MKRYVRPDSLLMLRFVPSTFYFPSSVAGFLRTVLLLFAKESISLRNPLTAVAEASKVIEKMVHDGQSVEKIDAVTERLMLFVKKLLVAGYKPRRDQVDKLDAIV